MTTPIPENQAIADTHNWREFYGSTMGVDPNGPDVFRGFRIPISDFHELLDKAREIDESSPGNPVVAVRAYLARHTEGAEKDSMHVVLVPVVAADDQVAYPYGKDMLSFQGESTIYDFTTPCPEQCDTRSQLYASK